MGARRPIIRKAFAALRERTLRMLDLHRLKRRAFIALSNGEMRRVLLARELASAKRKLSGYLQRHPNVAAILVSHRQDDIPPLFKFGITLQSITK